MAAMTQAQRAHRFNGEGSLPGRRTTAREDPQAAPRQRGSRLHANQGCVYLP